MITCPHRSIDWAASESRARSMTFLELLGAIRDIRETIEAADALDQMDGGSRGGLCRDEASVIHAELRRRGEERPA